MSPNKPSKSRLKNMMMAAGFKHFQWFRRWYGGHWTLTCDFFTYVCENAKGGDSRYPDRFVTESFQFVLMVEHYE